MVLIRIGQFSLRKITLPDRDIISPEVRQAQAEESQKAVTMGIFLIASFIVEYSYLFYLLDSMYISGFFVVFSIVTLFMYKKLSKKNTPFDCRVNESAEWFNVLLNRWWVFSSSSIEKIMKKHLNERLSDIQLRFIHSLELVAFSVGEKTPKIKNLRTRECSDGTPGSLQHMSWFNVFRPPICLDRLSSHQVVVEADINMIPRDFKMLFRGHLGSSSISMGFDLAVEDFHLNGTVQAIICLSMDVPFPHITKATVSFKERPDVTFNIGVWNMFNLMKIPVLKSWIHNNLMKVLTKAIVYPACLDLPIQKDPTLMGQNPFQKVKHNTRNYNKERQGK